MTLPRLSRSPAGSKVRVKLTNGFITEIFVCRVPEAALREVLAVSESPGLITELVCFIRADFTDPSAGEESKSSIPVPDGYMRMPENWSDYLSEESLKPLHKKVVELNYFRAIEFGGKLIKAAMLDGRITTGKGLSAAAVALL